MMKKLTSLLLSAALMISLLACGAFAAKTKSGVRIAGLKGPTTMGLVNLLDMERSGKASQHYDLQLYGAADEIVPKLIKGELDMAAIPANLAGLPAMSIPCGTVKEGGMELPVGFQMTAPHFREDLLLKTGFALGK